MLLALAHVSFFWFFCLQESQACPSRDAHFTWFIDDAANATEIFHRAFQVYAKDTPLSFTRTHHKHLARITIEFHPRNDTLLINQRWTLNISDDLWSGALHYIGHAVGLHNVKNDAASAMYIYRNHFYHKRANFVLSERDKDTILDMYQALLSIGQVDDCILQMTYEFKIVEWNQCTKINPVSVKPRTRSKNHTEIQALFHHIVVTDNNHIFLSGKWKMKLHWNVIAVAQFEKDIITVIYDNFMFTDFHLHEYFPTENNLLFKFNIIQSRIIGAGRSQENALLYDYKGNVLTYTKKKKQQHSNDDNRSPPLWELAMVQKLTCADEDQSSSKYPFRLKNGHTTTSPPFKNEKKRELTTNEIVAISIFVVLLVLSIIGGILKCKAKDLQMKRAHQWFKSHTYRVSPR